MNFYSHEAHLLIREANYFCLQTAQFLTTAAQRSGCVKWAVKRRKPTCASLQAISSLPSRQSTIHKISSKTANILIEFLCEFPQQFHANSGICQLETGQDSFPSVRRCSFFFFFFF
jgi:hypothetical protein